MDIRLISVHQRKYITYRKGIQPALQRAERVRESIRRMQNIPGERNGMSKEHSENEQRNLFKATGGQAA